MKVILLAAGVGKRFGRATKKLPKCLIPLGAKDECLLSRYLKSFQELHLNEIVIVVGHLKNKIKAHCKTRGKGLNIRFVENTQYKRGSIVSLFTASEYLKNDVLIMDADVYFPSQALRLLLRSAKKSAFLADTRAKSTGEEMMLMAKKGRLYSIAKKLDNGLKPIGEATGILKLGKKDTQLLSAILKDFVSKKILDVEYEEAYSSLMKKRTIGLVKIDDFFWTEMDFEADRKKILKSCQNKL